MNRQGAKNAKAAVHLSHIAHSQSAARR